MGNTNRNLLKNQTDFLELKKIRYLKLNSLDKFSIKLDTAKERTSKF